MPKIEPWRLGKRASGVPPELMRSILTGAGSAPISLPNSSGRDGLVSVVRHVGGTAMVDITETASLVGGTASGAGSIVPGANVGTSQLEVWWYKFS